MDQADLPGCRTVETTIAVQVEVDLHNRAVEEAINLAVAAAIDLQDQTGVSDHLSEVTTTIEADPATTTIAAHRVLNWTTAGRGFCR